LRAIRTIDINVAPALEEIRCGGRLRARFGRRCDELSGDQARQLLESRRRYDWSAEPSGMRLAQAVPAALDLARRFYRDEHGRNPPSTLALVTQLGLTVPTIPTADDGSSTGDRAAAPMPPCGHSSMISRRMMPTSATTCAPTSR
jgi:hypothetical protein